MLHACDQKFDVTENLENFCELNKASLEKGVYFKSRASAWSCSLGLAPDSVCNLCV